MKISKILRAGFAALSVAAFAAPAQAAPILLGDGTLNTANDLTVVQNGTINYEFLDLTATYGMSVNGSLGLYGGSGFRWANGADMTELFGAFNIAYGHFPGGGLYQPLPVNPSLPFEFASLAAHLGKAPGIDGALGWIDEDTTLTNHTYVCVGNACTPKVFLQQGQPFWPTLSIIGTFLVRSYDTTPTPEGNAVPAPGSLALLVVGLLGIGARRRK